ncbi:hypothetical protein [Chryseobacterium oryctis]|uniref:Glycosyltransferase RgtA/B/C/D-like domain-containing protein n=1 Tax=Chryseobacterium oryctis TaxID=2952618 RepID=A0ABT3HR55_9FLAO|nr:hypothetical protein [Chryseobacterium oryctis]MCW3162103.1 hypothetical protein [Chryseobacterium oryctis]
MKSLLITLGLFLGICFIYILIMLSTTENFFTYILDDAYIHLAIAKNFAIHKVWGMTPYRFSSSSSSPIFTFILSVLIYIFGNNELIPLVFNLICSVFCIYYLNKYYSQYLDKNRNVVIASLFTLFFAVVQLQILSGMEHVLQCLIIIVNVFFFQKWSRQDFESSNAAYWFYFTIALLGLVRFESMFYFVAFAFLFVCLKRFKDALLVILFGFIPILIFGFFNYQEDGYFFPNSVVVKGTSIDFSGNYMLQITHFLSKIFLNVTFYKIGFFPLLMVVVFTFRDYKKGFSLKQMIENNFLLYVFTITLLLHGVFGNFRGFFRYEAYLMVGFAMVFIPKIISFFINPVGYFKSDWIMTVLILGNIMLMFYKSGYGHRMIISGSDDIYQQQIQSGKFLNKYYNTSKVVANDIGAICYFSDIHLFDFAGLASVEAIPYNKNEKEFGQDFENFLTKYTIDNKYELVIVYEEWLNGRVPKNWKKVAILKISNTISVAQDHVVIYSINPKIYDQLKNNIKNFNWNKNVKVEIID